jgi:hypothetical protein
MRRKIGACAAGIALAFWASPIAPAVADQTANLRSAVQQARAGTSCGALRTDSIAEQVAARVNRSTVDYMNHTATDVPISDPLPGLKILGYGGSHATLVQGASRDEAESIKSLILLGYDKIPNCAYTDFGVDTRTDESTGYVLTAVVLAGA